MSKELNQAQDQLRERENHPTPAELFKGWQEGGREKLRELLKQIDDDEELVIDKELMATMTEEERGDYFSELVHGKRTFVWAGLRCIYDPNLGPVSFSC